MNKNLRNIVFAILMWLLPSSCIASIIVKGPVTLDNTIIEAEYVLDGMSARLGTGFNACIPHYSEGELVVPSTITVGGTDYPVTEISPLAFRLCSRLTRVVLSEGLTRVGDFAFFGCQGMLEVALPSTLATIGTGAFFGLSSLQNVIVYAETPPVWEYNDVFCFHVDGIGDAHTYHTDEVVLFVPYGKEDVYRNANYTNNSLGWTTPDGWGYFNYIRSLADYNPAPYAMFENGVLYFFNDGIRVIRTGDTYDLNTGNTAPGWSEHSAEIASVVFDPMFSDVTPATTAKWFYGCSNMETIDGWEYLNTSMVTNMSDMFSGCSSLAALDLRGFDARRCTDFEGMFTNCSSLQTLVIPASICDAGSMFTGCIAMQDVYYYGSQPFTNWDGGPDAFAPAKATFFHVVSSTLDAWVGAWGVGSNLEANVTFVDDLGTSNNPIPIYEYADWCAVADLVEAGLTVNAIMMDDVTVTTMMGTVNKPFGGIFYGNNHTLTANIDESSSFVAPFHAIRNATIRDLTVDGTVRAHSDYHQGGLVGTCVNGDNVTNTIVNCHVSTHVIGDNRYFGGIIGHGHSVNNIVSGCLFDGKLSATGTYGNVYGGYIIGWCDDASKQIVVNCVEQGSCENVNYVDFCFAYVPNGSAVQCARAVVPTNSYRFHDGFEGFFGITLSPVGGAGHKAELRFGKPSDG